MKIKKNSCTYNIVKMLSLCGEIPLHLKHLFSISIDEEGYYFYSSRTITQSLLYLKENKIIQYTGSAKNKMIRFKKNGLELLFDLDNKFHSNFLQNYLFISDNHKFHSSKDDKNIDRKSKMAEMIIYFYLSKNIVFLHEKNNLFNDFQDKKINIQKNSFYISKEFKNLNSNNEKNLKIHFSKIMGLYFTNDKIFPTYHLGEELFVWNMVSEKKANNIIFAMLNNSLINFKNYFSENDSFFESDVLIFGNSYNVILDDLKKQDTFHQKVCFDKKNQNEDKKFDFKKIDFMISQKNKNMKSKYSLNFKDMHFIPTNKDNCFENILLLSLFQEKNLLNKLINYINKIKQINLIFSKKHDFLLENKLTSFNSNEYHFQFFDSNITNLELFVNYMISNIRDIHYSIHCFEWQKDFLVSYINKKILFHTQKMKMKNNHIIELKQICKKNIEIIFDYQILDLINNI